MIFTYTIQVLSKAFTAALIHFNKEILTSLSSDKNSAAIRNAVALVHINLEGDNG